MFLLVNKQSHSTENFEQIFPNGFIAVFAVENGHNALVEIYGQFRKKRALENEPVEFLCVFGVLVQNLLSISLHQTCEASLVSLPLVLLFLSHVLSLLTFCHQYSFFQTYFYKYPFDLLNNPLTQQKIENIPEILNCPSKLLLSHIVVDIVHQVLTPSREHICSLETGVALQNLTDDVLLHMLLAFIQKEVQRSGKFFEILAGLFKL